MLKTPSRFGSFESYQMFYKLQEESFYIFNKYLKLKSPEPLNSNDIVLITGGSQGLGWEIVKLLICKNVKIIIVDILEPNLETLNYDKIWFYRYDLSQKDDIYKLYLKIKLNFSFVTVLINNAGITHIGSIEKFTNDMIEKIFQTNLLSSINLTDLFIKDSIKLNEGKGVIVNISSILGVITPARLTTYGGSKGALIEFHKFLNRYLESQNEANKIYTLLVCPGKIRTNMFKNVATPSSLLAPDIKPHELAEQIIDTIERRDKQNLRLPYYTNFIPIVKRLDWPYIFLIKKLSGMDRATDI